MKSYFRILSYARSHFSRGILATVFLLIYNFFSIFTITLLVPFLQVLFSGEAELQARAVSEGTDIKSRFYAQIAQWVIDYGQFQVLVGICTALFLALMLKNLFRYMSSYQIAPFEQAVINNMRNHLFGHLSKLSMSFFTGRKKGQIINVLVTDVQIVQESVVGTLQAMISDPLTMILILLTMFFISWKLSVFTLIVLPLAAVFIAVISRSLRRKARKGQEKLGEIIGQMDEFISGIRIVKAFGTEEYERSKFQRYNDQYRRMMVSLRRRSDLASPVTETLAVFVLVTVVLFGGNMVMNGGLEPAELIGLIALFGQFILPIKTLSGAVARIQKGLASFQRVEEFLNIPESVKESDNAIPVRAFEDNIRFEGVSFQYETELVLKDISIEIKKGETLALVGPSGGGKSTLADLLPRYYDPTAGRILFDGKELRNLNVNDLRSLIGVVTQEGILFNDSIKNNIAYGDSKPDMARVEQAARVANAMEFISTLPEGFDTQIGERGTKLSGGQRQRLAIARAVYKDAPILILDEATSALDSESERLVQEALDKLVKNRTSIVIAHRLSTITKANRICVIDHGAIVESGTHDELLAKGGLYKKLYDFQFSK